MIMANRCSNLMVVVSVCFISLFAASVVNAKGEAEADRVYNLPGQPNVSFAHYAGYVTVNESHGRALFYWFFQAQDEPSQKPLVLWLNGGPGCSSIGYGASIELGPFHVKKDGAGLYLNKFSWNKEANLLFLESPVGVGFSYTNTSSDFLSIDDTFAAEDSYEFLVRWFQRFPEFKSRDFYIAGESYAGHYVPQLAELVYDRRSRNDSKYHINLIGFIVGNPETDDYYDYQGMTDYAWSHAIVSDQTYSLIKKECSFKNDNWTKECSSATDTLFEGYSKIDMYNLYAPLCLRDTGPGLRTTERVNLDNKVSRRNLRGLGLYGGYDPCFEVYPYEYFNRPDVQHALHANITDIPFPWDTCNNTLFSTYNVTVFSILPIYSKLITAGLRIWVYSGDIDGRVPVLSTRYCMNALNLQVEEKWQAWYHRKQVGGWHTRYKGLTYLTFRGAGHMVPFDKPDNAFYVFKTYLQNQLLRTQR